MAYEVEFGQQGLLLDEVFPAQSTAPKAMNEYKSLVLWTANGVRPDLGTVAGLDDLGSNNGADEPLENYDK